MRKFMLVLAVLIAVVSPLTADTVKVTEDAIIFSINGVATYALPKQDVYVQDIRVQNSGGRDDGGRSLRDLPKIAKRIFPSEEMSAVGFVVDAGEQGFYRVSVPVYF